MTKQLKRISLMIREDQYQAIGQSGLNLSGLFRDLLDDHFSEYKIILSVSEETKELYNLVISNTGSTDEDLETYLKDGLKNLLADKIESMQQLKEKLDQESEI
jgi:hypothetical protein